MYQLYKHPPLAGINRQLLACGGLHDPGPLAVKTVNYTTVFSSDNYCCQNLFGICLSFVVYSDFV